MGTNCNSVGHLEIVWVTTLNCNASCDYCFQNREKEKISLENGKTVADKVLHFAAENRKAVNFYFQGGEATLLPIEFYKGIMDYTIGKYSNLVSHKYYFQTNLLNYNSKWGDFYKEYFWDIGVGTSIDYPNLYRKSGKLKGDEFNDYWLNKYKQARKEGVSVAPITQPNNESIKMGAKKWINYFIKCRLSGIQINYTFPGQEDDIDTRLDPVKLGDFLVEAFDYANEVGFGISNLKRMEMTVNGTGAMWCCNSVNCAFNFLCINPDGTVGLCDCWVGKRARPFGNILSDSMDTILQSNNRQEYIKRASKTVLGHCKGCEYLPLCNGGCIIRAYSHKGDITEKDYFCETYKKIFSFAISRYQKSNIN